MKSRRVVLAGGSVQVGRILARHFHSRGDSVVVLSRKPANEPLRAAKWDGVTIGPWMEELNNADLVINLAGRSVNCRYNSRNRREILESRLISTEILGPIQQVPHPPRQWLNASTGTIYRHALDRPMDEFTRLSSWLSENRERIGCRYASEVARHYKVSAGQGNAEPIHALATRGAASTRS